MGGCVSFVKMVCACSQVAKSSPSVLFPLVEALTGMFSFILRVVRRFLYVAVTSARLLFQCAVRRSFQSDIFASAPSVRLSSSVFFHRGSVWLFVARFPSCSALSCYCSMLLTKSFCLSSRQSSASFQREFAHPCWTREKLFNSIILYNGGVVDKTGLVNESVGYYVPGVQAILDDYSLA